MSARQQATMVSEATSPSEATRATAGSRLQRAARLARAVGVGLAAGAAAGAAAMLWRALTEAPIPLRGRVVLITGGSRGLGLVLARAFAARGCRLALCARDPDGLERARAELARSGAVVYAAPCDVADQAALRAFVNDVIARYGSIDVLVNNASIIQVGPLEVLSSEDFRHAMDVNFFGALHATLAVMPQMIRQHAGRIVNITSIAARVHLVRPGRRHPAHRRQRRARRSPHRRGYPPGRGRGHPHLAGQSPAPGRRHPPRRRGGRALRRGPTPPRAGRHRRRPGPRPRGHHLPHALARGGAHAPRCAPQQRDGRARDLTRAGSGARGATTRRARQ